MIERPGSGLSSLEGGSLASDKPISVARPAWLVPGSNRPEKVARMGRAGSGHPAGGGTVHPYTGPPARPGSLGSRPCELPGRAKMSSVSPGRAEAGHWPVPGVPSPEPEQRSQTQTAVSRVETDHPAILTTRVMARNPPQPRT